jgi:hypothetical protein
MQPNKLLVNFIKEARKRGFDDYEIKEPLLQKGWLLNDIELALASLKPKIQYKNQITIYLDNDILKIIDKRAKKNLFTIPEQIEDILRRSCVSTKKSNQRTEKLDDLLVSLFSRKVYKK